MDEAIFQAFGDEAVAAVQRKRAAIDERYGLARATRWDRGAPDRDVPEFRILAAGDEVLFGCTGLEVGTFSPATSTWKWGWANKSLSEAHRRRLLPLRELAEITGKAAFRYEDPFETDLDSAWTIAAIAAEHLGAAGCYDARITNLNGEALHVYLAYMDVPSDGPAPATPGMAAAPGVAAMAGRDDGRRVEAEPSPADLPATASDRPRGMVSFNILMVEAEVRFFQRCLETLDREPPFDDLDDDFRRAFGATPERVLGELQPLSHPQQRVAVAFRFRGKDGDPHDICDITSLNIDIAALAMLIAVAVPSAQPGGFTFTPMGLDFVRDDPRLLAQPDGGLVRITPSTIQISATGVPPEREFRQWTFHVP